MVYQYRVVTHAGNIYVEYCDTSVKTEWKKWRDPLWTHFTGRCIYCDRYFATVWGAKWWIRRQVKKDKKAATLKAEKAKAPEVVWGPYP